MRRAALGSFLLVLAAVTTGHGGFPRPTQVGTDLTEALPAERARLQGTWVSTSVALPGAAVPCEFVLWIDGDQCHFPAYGCCSRHSESRAFSVDPGRIRLTGYSPIPYAWSGDTLVIRVDADELFRQFGSNPYGPGRLTIKFERHSDK